MKRDACPKMVFNLNHITFLQLNIFDILNLVMPAYISAPSAATIVFVRPCRDSWNVGFSLGSG